MRRVRDTAKHASVPLRRVRAGELRREDFLYILKAGPAGGRLRRPSSAGRRHGSAIETSIHHVTHFGSTSEEVESDRSGHVGVTGRVLWPKVPNCAGI